jgi:hypothetical protein
VDSNEMTPQVEPTVEAAPAIPAFLAGLDPAKRDEVLRKLGKIKDEATPESTLPSMVAEEVPAEPAKPQAEVLSGKDVDWSEYNLDYNVKHLYPEARFQNTPQGPKWVALLDEFDTSSRDYDGKGMTRLKDGSSRHLGTFLGDMLNSPEGWKLISVLPTGSRAGVIFQRSTPVILPDPIAIKTTTEVEAPKDEELSAIEDKAAAFNAEVVSTPEDVQSDLRAQEEEQQ